MCNIFDRQSHAVSKVYPYPSIHYWDSSRLTRKDAIDMTRKNHESQEFESIHIGKIIEEELRRQERTVTWLSRKIHCDRRNIYDIFSRTSIDTDLLFKLSIALNRDFFAYFSANLQLSNNQSLTPPRQLTDTTSCNPANIIEPVGPDNPGFGRYNNNLGPATDASGTLTYTQNPNCWYSPDDIL